MDDVDWRVALFGGLALGCLALGSLAFGADQQQEREKEQANYRAGLQKLKAQLNATEDELAALCFRFGEKNEQVRILTGEVERLRHVIGEWRRAA